MHGFLMVASGLLLIGIAVTFWRIRQKSETLQYLYFIRFSLVLWLFPPLFAIADMDATRSLSRGIFIPEFFPSYVVVGFFLVTTGFVALVTARVTIIHGEERFRAERPVWMTRWFVNDQAKCENRPVFLSLIPAFLTSIYLGLDGDAEGVNIWRIVVGLVLGWAMAFAFWALVNAWYYLSFRFTEPEDVREIVRLGQNAARTILFPRWVFRLRKPGDEIFSKKTLEDIVTQVRPRSLRPQAEIGNIKPENTEDSFTVPHPVAPQPIEEPQTQQGFYTEAESFTFLSALGSLGLYLLLWPLTAPVPTGWCLVSLSAELFVLLIVLWIFLRGRFATTRPPETDRQKRKEQNTLRFWKCVLSGFAVFFAAVFASVYLFSFGDRFPTLASVLLLVLVLLWLLSALAYWLDQYRVPVLTIFLLMGILPRALHIYGSSEEHYISTIAAPAGSPQPETPAQIITEKLASNGNSLDRPYIIITATGGGLHASAWTALLLKQFNERLGQDAQSFWSHVILMSTVSGSSFTLSYYLHELELAKGKEIGQPGFDRIVRASTCSSLEAVGWGLAYYDVPRAIVPLLPQVLLPHSSGAEDLAEMPYFKDRTWALRRAIERNQDDKYCQLVQRDDEDRDNKTQKLNSPQFNLFPWRELLKERLWPGAGRLSDPLSLAKLQDIGFVPAFTMNTTTAEAGDRFLLANYRLPGYDLGAIEGPPAESFLNIFPAGNAADLPLSTAAQMSATFPYVSSAARIPGRYADMSVHFVDGGYFDNDGTASAIEFLRYALDAPASESDDRQKSDAAKVAGLADLLKTTVGGSKGGPSKKLKVLLIEIRNSKDEDPRKTPAVPKAFSPLAPDAGKYNASDALDQLLKPLDAFWSAGHDSVTSRDRNGLDLLIESHRDNLDLHHVVFDDQTQSDSKSFIKSAQDPLSWSLTPKERSELKNDSGSTKMTTCIDDAIQQFTGKEKDPSKGWERHALSFRCEDPATVPAIASAQPISKLTP